MRQGDRAGVERAFPELRRDFESSRELVTHALERAKGLAERAAAMRRLLESRARQPSPSVPPEAAIWNAAAEEFLRVSHERDRELGIVAHELRQSLGAALSADRVLAVSTDAAITDHARGVLTRQLLHLSQLVESLLEYSRLSVPPAPASRTHVEIARLLDEAIEIVDPARAERGQLLRAAPCTDGDRVVGDATRLRQAMVNLLQNAVRYTPAGGRIDAAVRCDSRHVVLEIRDNGDGIPAGMLTRIFEPFVRASEGGPGLGIGLALVRRIAELHGGTIVAQSDGPGCGSVFTLTLPSADSGEAGRP